MNIEELEEALDELFPERNFSIETDSHGQIVIHTGMKQDDDGELVTFDTEEDEDFDPDTDQLEDEEDADEE
jgi:hypothetical protein